MSQTNAAGLASDLQGKLEQDTFGVISPRLVAFSVIENLFQFFRQTEIHDASNQIFNLCLENLCRALRNLNSLPGYESLEISFRGEQIYVNKLRLRPHVRQFRQSRHLLRFIRKRKLGVLKLSGVVDPENIRVFLWAIVRVDPKDLHPVETVRAALQSFKIHDLDVEALKVGQHNLRDTDGHLQDSDLIGLLLHKNIRKSLEIYFDNYERSIEFKLPNLKDLVTDLIELDEEELLQIFRLNLFKRHERLHAVLGADLSFCLVAWGRSIGLPAGVLMDLARIGLAYPLVYLARDAYDMAPLSSEECRKVLTLMDRLKSVWSFSEPEKLAILESTQAFGPEGMYLRDGSKCYAHFFSRMLRVVARFRYWTQTRAHFDALLPDEAMAELVRQDHDVDPSLLKLFVNWIGIYPVGTLLELQTGELVQVFAAGVDPTRFQRPIVSVIRNMEGQVLDRPYLLDLMEMNEKLGVYKKSIKRSLSLEDAKISDDVLKRSPLPLA